MESEENSGEIASKDIGKGRPTKYDPTYAAIARGMTRMGATTFDLAVEFGVHTDTIHQWRVTHEDFSEALKIRKGEYDDRVEKSLAERAVGYTRHSEKVTILKDGTVIRTPIVEHIPPDPGAAKMWLSARRAKEWNEAKKLEISGTDGAPLVSDMELARRMLAIIESSQRSDETPQG